ncbi:MAG: hypothetical protein IPG45_28840 [Deltaproteobacteria bacterium]|jgi:hypothetical protein|nr:hypothetical protein [Deltaproteobacteria bacterium]
MTTPKTGNVLRGQAPQAKNVSRGPAKTTFEASLAAAAQKLREPSTNTAEAQALEIVKDEAGKQLVRSLLTTQKPGQIDREKAVNPEDED